jgi:hypothetical protein
MNLIPTKADWDADQVAAKAACDALIAALSQDAANSNHAVALGIAAQVLAAAAPIAGGALAGPLGTVGGTLAGAALTEIADSLSSQHATALAALTPGQQQLVTTAVQAGAALAAAKLTPAKASP